MVVISVSLSGKELRELDGIVSELNYSSRSSAVRDAVHKLLQNHRWVHLAGHKSHFLVSLVYPERRKYEVLEVIHRFSKLIHSSAHTHLNSTCTDQLVIRGGGEEALEMVRALTTLPDVNLCNCVV